AANRPGCSSKILDLQLWNRVWPLPPAKLTDCRAIVLDASDLSWLMGIDDVADTLAEESSYSVAGTRSALLSAVFRKLVAHVLGGHTLRPVDDLAFTFPEAARLRGCA